MVLKANKNYWMGAPYFDTVDLKVVPSSANRVLLLKQGAIDIARDLSPDEIDAVPQHARHKGAFHPHAQPVSDGDEQQDGAFRQQAGPAGAVLCRAV